VPGQFSLEPFIQRRIDVLPVYATDQPNVARKQGVDFELILPRDYGVVIMGDVLFATSEFIEQHPNTVQAFVSASLRGWQWAIENPEETVELIAAYNQELDPEQLAFEAEETIELLTYRVGSECVGWNDPAAWAAEQELLLELDILEEPVAMDAVATNRFVDTYYEAQGIDCAAEASTR
jgi:ABC-type nitrate/sulfonate/bicarbonate transport system substrate-binding protein